MRKNNLGISLLKTFMSFGVVLAHFWIDQSYIPVLKPFKILVKYAVPVFMLLSFYLTANKYLKKDITYIKKRIERLAFPHVWWTVIYWLISIVLSLVSDNVNLIKLEDVFWQIISGHSLNINSAMWFQTVLILLTLLFGFLFVFFSEKIAIVWIIILMIFSFAMQYSGINYQLFGGLRYELSYPLGRIIEMIPYAVIGFLIAYYKILEKCNNKRKIIISVLILVLLIILNISIKAPKGFYYSGIKSVIIGVLLVAIAYQIPFESVSPKVELIINQFSRYTLGVYCMHNLLGREVVKLFEKVGLETGTFFMCCLIYGGCYLISYFIAHIPVENCKKLIE